MLCETCGRRRSAVYYYENTGGRVRTFNLCQECAEAMKRSGELEDISAAYKSFAPVLLLPEEGVLRDLPIWGGAGESDAGKACPRCGATLADIASAGVGCAGCYTAFAQELAPLLPTLGGRSKHEGGSPASYRARKERAEQIAALRRELTAAVRAERFEDAAGLRDRIRELGKEEREHELV